VGAGVTGKGVVVKYGVVVGGVVGGGVVVGYFGYPIKNIIFVIINKTNRNILIL